MGNYFDLIAAINAAIKTNGEQGITGASLNAILRDMVAALGAGYQYVGVVAPDAAAPSTDYNAVYLGLTAGTYTNFGGTQVRGGQFGVFTFNGSWTYNVADIASGGYVRYDAAQTLTNGEATQARSNIDAASNADVNAKYTKPSGGIPKTDLALAVRARLDKADIAACVTRRSMEETGVAFDPSGESFIVFASNYQYVEVYFIECGEDYTNVRVTMLSEPDAELGPLVDFYPYDGELLVWAYDTIDLSVIRLGEPGQVEFTIVADKSGADPKIEPELFVRKSLLDALLAVKANVDGYYGGMTVGSAENLVGRGSVEAEYVNRRTSAGTADIGSGSAAITRIKGRSVVWNQLVETTDFATKSLDDGSGVFTNNGDGSYTITTTGTTTNTLINGGGSANVIIGHKILVRATGDADSHFTFRINSSLNIPCNSIYTAATNMAYPRVASGLPAGTYTIRFGVIDLTLLGIDNLTTVEEVEAWLAENIGPLDYYAYNPGEVINNAAEGIKTRGFNLFNYATGKAYLPGKYSDYPYEYEICGTFTSISFTDVNGNTSVPELHDGRFFNVDAPGELTVVGGNNTDTLVHLVWSGWRNEGEPDYVYEPYWENTLNLGLTSLTGKINGEGSSVTVFPHGLAKVGDVQDEIVGNRAIKRIGIHAYQSGDESDTSVLTDYTNTYYALATPEEYILDNPPQFNYRVDDFSTEETVPSYDPSNVIAPLAYDVQYAMNAVDAIRRLPDNYVERTDVKQATGNSEKFVLSQKAVNDNYAKKVGVEDNLTVGLAKNIEGNATSGGYPFTFVKISGTDGLAKINDVRGNSLVWNQLVDKGDFTNSSTVNFWPSNGPTKEYEDNSMKLTGSGNDQSVYRNLSVPVAGHKYLCLFTMKASATGLCGCGYGGTYKVDAWSVGVEWKTFGYILTAAAANRTCYIYCTLTNERIVYVRYANVFDLTLMFGAGNEPSTVDEFEALFPLPYYDYNAGEIISNKTEQIKVVGFNQWDEEWELGIYNYTTGQPTPSTQAIRSKNYTPCFGGVSYYFKVPGTSSLRILWYDADKNFISALSNGNYNNTAQTAPANAAYLRIGLPSAYGTTYNHDICINLSDPSRNGTYEPYKTNTIELNLPTLTGKVNGEGESVVIAADGLKSAGSVYDEGIVENGYLTKIVKRIGVVDMGTLTYTKNAVSSSYPYGYFASPVAGRSFTNVGILCSKYPTVSAWNTDKVIRGTTSNSNIYVIDSAYAESDAATFKTAMSGVMLYYELATPVTYVLDTPIPATFQSYKGGTLKQIPENGSVPTTAPHAMSVTYAIDAAGILTGLPQDYISKESLQAMLVAMQSAGLFSAYTMTFNSSTGKYEFTFTPNA